MAQWQNSCNKKYGVLLMLFLCSTFLNAQQSLTLSPSHININFDTTATESEYHHMDFNVYDFVVRVRVQNNGPLDLVPDGSCTNFAHIVPKLIKAYSSAEMNIPLTQLLPSFKHALPIEKNIELCFRPTTDGNINAVKATISVHFTNGPSRLVHIENTRFELDTAVQNILRTNGYIDSSRYSHGYSIDIQRQLYITNLSDSAIFVPKAGQAWSDTGPRLNYYYQYGLKRMPPKTKLAISVNLNMSNKECFDVYGNLIVHTTDYSEIDLIFTRFRSTFRLK